MITATQLTARVPAGAPADPPPVLFPEPGTPARASFEVLGLSGVTSVRAPAEVEPVASAGGDLDSTVWIVLTAAFGAVALSLFGGGLVAFIHQTRQSKVPAEARWIPPGWYKRPRGASGSVGQRRRPGGPQVGLAEHPHPEPGDRAV